MLVPVVGVFAVVGAAAIIAEGVVISNQKKQVEDLLANAKASEEREKEHKKEINELKQGNEELKKENEELNEKLNDLTRKMDLLLNAPEIQVAQSCGAMYLSNEDKVNLEEIPPQTCLNNIELEKPLSQNNQKFL
ncbi:hypothetical protein [Wolbachia endosymbiont of Pentidionis agamae]|uniref:hypothetical protein n=1 Tax=Wolbachia endosymbiont of Pentidionis agamae TaxID=3110435 RepID=UPI002FD4D768